VKEAEALNQEVLKADKENALAYYAQGRILLAQDKKQDAATALQRAAVLAPNNALVQYLFGTVQASLGNAKWPGSLHQGLGTAAEYDGGLRCPGGSGGCQRRPGVGSPVDGEGAADGSGIHAGASGPGASAPGKGDLGGSEAILREVLSREPASVPALTVLAAINIRQGKSKEFLNRVAPLVQQQPQNAGLRYLLALAYHLTGDGQRAEAEAKEALKLNPKTPRIHMLLASIYLAANRLEEVKSELRAAIESDPRDLTNLSAAGGPL
jgi:predicted Zn-dependent protease